MSSTRLHCRLLGKGFLIILTLAQERNNFTGVNTVTVKPNIKEETTASPLEDLPTGLVPPKAMGCIITKFKKKKTKQQEYFIKVII